MFERRWLRVPPEVWGLALLFLGLVVTVDPVPSHGDFRAWTGWLAENFPYRIFGSSHLAHTLVGTAYRIHRMWNAAANPVHVLMWLSRLHGFIYTAAVFVFVRSIGPRVGQTLFALGAFVSPIALFCCGYVEIGHWPMVWICLATACALSKPRRINWVIVSLSLAACLHGLGFFFFTLGAMHLLQQRSIREAFLPLLALFGANGIAFLGYLMLTPYTQIQPGDAHGGANGSLLLGLRSWWLFHPDHLAACGLILLLAVPAAIGSVRVRRWPLPRRESMIALSCMAPALFFLLFFHTQRLGWLSDADMLFPVFAPMQLILLRIAALRGSRSSLSPVLSIALTMIATATIALFLRESLAPFDYHF